MWHKVTKQQSSVNTVPRYSSPVTFGLEPLTSLYSRCLIWGCRVDKFALLCANHKSYSFRMSSSEGSAASFRHTGFTGVTPQFQASSMLSKVTVQPPATPLLALKDEGLVVQQHAIMCTVSSIRTACFDAWDQTTMSGCKLVMESLLEPWVAF